MAYWLRPYWPGIRLCGILTLLCTLVVASEVPGVTNAAIVGHASNTTISVFYPATKATLDAWSATTSTARPAETTTFGAGTTLVAFYFEYAGATPHKTQYTIVIFSHGGGLFLRHGPYVFTHATALHMSPVPALHDTYPAGRYHAELLIDGQVAAMADFTIQGVSGATATIFYPATKATYDAWEASTSDARPPRADVFQAGSSVVAFYFEYTGATARVTQWKLVIHNASGAVFAAKGPYPLSYSTALAMRYVTAPSGSYPAGAYQVDLLLDGQVAAQTSFTVAAQSVTISTFFPATRATYDAWEASRGDAPPARTTSFGAGTTAVTFYFAFHGAQANLTPFEIVVRDHAGAQVATHGPYTLSLGAGLHMSKVAMASGVFPNGAYRADLLVDGHVAASTFFSMGAEQAAQPCRASDVLATCVVPSVLRLHANLANNMEAEGTGFVVQSDSSGTYLLTNKHVVDGASPSSMVALSPDGHTQYRVLAMQSTAAEEGTAGDLAVVKLPPSALRPLTWGDSTQLHLLQPVISVGYGDAFNLPGPPSVTEGTISALGRDMGDGYGPVWIQHQSFINHGNSGGPLLDTQYEVVGVNTLSMKNTQGIFLAIPSALARNIARTLIAQLQGQ